MNAPVKPGAFRVDGLVPAPPADAIIRFEQVGKTFAGRDSQEPVTALAGIDLVVPRGSIVGVIGRSGAGKSTLIRLVNGLERATSGRILIESEDVTNLTEAGWRERRRATGMIFQHFNLLSSRTVFDNVALPLEIAGVPKAKIEAQVSRLLALVGLSDKRERYPAELSGGQKQRVGIARALSIEPKIMLMDEPFSALDALTRGTLQDEVRGLCRTTGQTVFMITHDVDEAIYLADKIVLMTNGPDARIAEIVVNPLPADRSRHDVHKHPAFYPVRNHIIDFLVTRSKSFAAELAPPGKVWNRRSPPLVTPGATDPTPPLARAV